MTPLREKDTEHPDFTARERWLYENAQQEAGRWDRKEWMERAVIAVLVILVLVLAFARP